MQHNYLLSPPSHLLTLPSGPKARSSISPSWALNSSTFSRLGTCSQTTTMVSPGTQQEHRLSHPSSLLMATQHKFHSQVSRTYVQFLTILALLLLTFLFPNPPKPHLPDTNVAIRPSSGKQGIIMVEAYDFLQWIRAKVRLHRLQILYSEFYSLLMGFSSRFLLCWG